MTATYQKPLFTVSIPASAQDHAGICGPIPQNRPAAGRAFGNTSLPNRADFPKPSSLSAPSGVLLVVGDGPTITVERGVRTRSRNSLRRYVCQDSPQDCAQAFEGVCIRLRHGET